LEGDSPGAKEAFTAARAEVEKIVREQPDYAEAHGVLGLIDAGLGRKEEAVRKGERAMALLPLEKDAINGALLSECLAVIYAWVGETDRALKQLAMMVKTPGDLSFGQLNYARSGTRFETIRALTKLSPRWHRSRRRFPTKRGCSGHRRRGPWLFLNREMIPAGRRANPGTYGKLDTLFSVFAPKDAQRIISLQKG
jgi:tetratricopeptide (TPR) repeat protein